MSVEVLSDALDGYRIEGELGRGAMGQVYGARHLRLERQVAIKRLPPGFAADPEVRSRFGSEAQVLASLDHPHVVPVYDYVEREDLCLLVMQALPGGTVWERFCNEGVSMTTACAVTLATCAGLSHAHERRVLHRDVKPDNLMFDQHRQLKVTDFGIAAVLGGEGTLATAAGEVIGTPAYMAPEQADGSAVGPPADVYAVATMLYELLSGRLPFSEDGEPIDLLRRRLTDTPVPLGEVAPSVPALLTAVVMTGLELDPSARPGTAESLGIEVARAAVGAWGPQWLDRSDVKLLAGGAMATAATTAARAPTTTASTTTTHGEVVPDERRVNETIAPGEVVPDERRVNETVTPGEVASGQSIDDAGTRNGGAEAQPPDPPPADPSAPTHAVVRPTVTTVRRGGADLSELAPKDMVPVTRAVGLPRVPWVSGALSVVCAALALFVGFGVIGADDPGPPPVAAGEVVVAGVDAVSPEPPVVDLAEPVPVVLGSPPEGAATLQIRFSVGGLPVGSSDEVPLEPVEGGFGATVSAASPRIISSGSVDAEMVVRSADGSLLDSPTIVIMPDRPLWLSVGGWVAILLTVLLLGYASSLIGPLRRGRRRVRSTIGMVIVGAAAGATVVLWAWDLGGPQPTGPTTLLAGFLGALSFGIGSLATYSLGRRRRLRRRLRARARARADAAARR